MSLLKTPTNKNLRHNIMWHIEEANRGMLRGRTARLADSIIDLLDTTRQHEFEREASETRKETAFRHEGEGHE